MKYYKLFCSFLKLLIVKLFNYQSNVIIQGFCYIDSKVDIEVGKESLFKIGRGLRVRKNTIIATRNNARLIIGNNVFINRNTIITARKSIIIGDNVTIGPNVAIYDHDHDIYHRGGYISDDIEIKKNVWIGANVIILKGVTIGDNSVIASGSIVTKNVPSNTVLIQKRQNTINSL